MLFFSSEKQNMASSNLNSSLSFKSCNTCHQIYKHLQTHVTLEHSLNGPEGVITNVIVNLLSLLVPVPQTGKPKETQQKHQPLQTVPIPVIAKQPDKQLTVGTSNSILPSMSPIRTSAELPSFSQEFSPSSSNELANITNRLHTQQELQSRAINMFSLPVKQSQQQKQQQLQPQQPQQQQKQSQLQEIEQKQPFQQKQQQHQQEDLQTSEASKQSPIPLNNLELQQVIIPQTANDIAVNHQIQGYSGLVNPDGSLTPAGISLLLSYQSGRGSSAGKTDLDDIADILVNKMPIPSLKGLDPANFQLSTFYLQQLALNQLQQAIVNTSTPSPVTPGPSGQIDSVSLGVVPTSSETAEDTYTKGTDVSMEGKHSVPDVGGGSDLMQILERHKQINGLIAAWNTKSHADKNSSENPSDLEQVVLPTIQSIQSSVGLSTTSSPAPLQMVSTTANIVRAVNSQSTASKVKFTHEISQQALDYSELGRKPATVNITQYMSHPTLIQVAAVDQHKDISSSNDTHLVDFTHDKSSSNGTTTNSTLHGLQNLILQTARRIAMDSNEGDVSKTGNLQKRNVVNVAVTPSDSKSLITNLQGIVIESSTRKDGDVDMEAIAKGESGRQERMYPSMTVVPISDYNSIDNGGDDGESTGSIVQQGDRVLYKCDYCGVTFSVLSTLHSHVKSAHSEKSEFCNYCQLSFTDHEEYYAHVASHRGEDNIYTCQFCTKIFTSHGDFKKHSAKHTQKRPYMCEHCQKTFRDPGSLAKHERIHTGEQPFICEICNRGFAEKSSLRKHSRVHSGEKPYKCQQCDKSFSISGNLQRHLLIHTGKKPFKCTLCTKAFNNPSHLRRHVKNLHNKTEDKSITPAVAADETMTQVDVRNLVAPRATMMDDELGK